MAASKRTRKGGAHSENGATPDSAGAQPVAKTRTRKPKAAASTAQPRQPEDRHASIAKAAYLRSQSRGFQPGFELEDWLAAEAEVDRRPTADKRPMGKFE
jgi:Protein of unknown function (DUF2934)